MKNVQVFSLIFAVILLSSCAAKKELASLTDVHTSTQDDLKKCTGDLATALAKVESLESNNGLLTDQVNNLKNTNAALLSNVGDLATLSKKEAENLEKSLESIKEKDMQIRTMRDAINKKDSVTLALVTSLKGVLGNLNDEDIEISVEKGVVFVSISDKLLFKSGSYTVNSAAKKVLEKVALVLNDKPEFEFMIEGHTDNVPVKTGVAYKDNWELSVLRSTAIVRVLQDDFKVDPKRMTAAGRSYYVPVADNDTAANRSKNRRTRVVILPKLDQFFGMIEDGMKKAE